MITADRMDRVGPVAGRATLPPPCGLTAPEDRRLGPRPLDRRPAACAPVAPARVSMPCSTAGASHLPPSSGKR